MSSKDQSKDKNKAKDKDKEKKKKKDDSSSSSSTPLDSLDTMGIEELQECMKQCAQQLAESRRQRNYFQLETDELQDLYGLLSDEISKTESHLKNIESQMERMQDTHRNDIKIYLQKVIHLEYEHKNNMESIVDSSHLSLVSSASSHSVEKRELEDLKSRFEQNIMDDEKKYEEELNYLRESERKELKKLKEQFERNYAELRNNYESKLIQLENDLILRSKMEIHELEERKNRHINDLMIHHNKNFKEIKSYYNSITSDNLELIKELNNEIEDLKLSHQQNEKAMEIIEKKNLSLTEPLKLAENRVKALKDKLHTFQQDKINLKHAKNRKLMLQQTLNSKMEEYHKIKQHYQELENERDRLYQTFEETVLSVDSGSSGYTEWLSGRLSSAVDSFELHKNEFSTLLRSSQLDPLVLSHVTKRLDDVLSSKNQQIEQLQYEIAKITKAHNDLIRVYQAKLNNMGVPPNQINLQTVIQTNPNAHPSASQSHQHTDTNLNSNYQRTLNRNHNLSTHNPSDSAHPFSFNYPDALGTAPADLIV